MVWTMFQPHLRLGHLPWLRTRWPPHSSQNASPRFPTCSLNKQRDKVRAHCTEVNSICVLLTDVRTWIHKAGLWGKYLHDSTNKSSLLDAFVTVRRQCCVCWGAWRRWAMWVSGPCSPATAAWLPGGRARHGETTQVAPCTPPASRGPPPSPWHLRLRGVHI